MNGGDSKLPQKNPQKSKGPPVAIAPATSTLRSCSNLFPVTNLDTFSHGTSLTKLLRRLYYNLNQFFRRTCKRRMGRLYILHIPFHATVLQENILQKRRKGLITHTSNVHELACKFGLLPRRRRSARIERAQRVWTEKTRQTIRFALLNVVEQDISSVFDEALSMNRLDDKMYKSVSQVVS